MSVTSIDPEAQSLNIKVKALPAANETMLVGSRKPQYTAL